MPVVKQKHAMGKLRKVLIVKRDNRLPAASKRLQTSDTSRGQSCTKVVTLRSLLAICTSSFLKEMIRFVIRVSLTD